MITHIDEEKDDSFEDISDQLGEITQKSKKSALKLNNQESEAELSEGNSSGFHRLEKGNSSDSFDDCGLPEIEESEGANTGDASVSKTVSSGLFRADRTDSQQASDMEMSLKSL